MDLRNVIITGVVYVKSECYIPYIPNDDRSFRDEVPIVLVVSGSCAGDAWEKVRSANNWEMLVLAPIGATGYHRRVSKMTALTYGKFSRSLKSGSRSAPTTVSISAWAFSWASG